MISTPDFTVIIPSRNRPKLVERAIESVVLQTHKSLEILVINDGSDGECEGEYERLVDKFSGRVEFLNLDKTSSGHGQSYAINFGAKHARGKYLCFLDDDDFWIDKGHLQRVKEIIAASNDSVDVHFSNQQACRSGIVSEEPGWLYSVQDYARENLQADEFGAYAVEPKDLLSCGGFGHPNTTVIKRSLFLGIGGFDRYVRCQTDRDLYLRIVDKAEKMVYSPVITAQHTVPDQSKTINMSTVISDLEKKLDNLYYQNKAVMFSVRREVITHAKKHKVYTLKQIARMLEARGDYRTAAHFAAEALLIGFTLKWLLYFFYIGIRSLFAWSR